MAKEKKAASDAPKKVEKVKVISTQTGFHGGARVREGKTFIFDLEEGKDLPKWLKLTKEEQAKAKPAKGKGEAEPEAETEEVEESKDDEVI